MSRHILLVVNGKLKRPSGVSEWSAEQQLHSLKAGMVITVEPGIYVPPVPQFPKAFHNIGIRIEVRGRIRLLTYSVLRPPQDEVLVGRNHPVVLSVAAPKEVGLFCSLIIRINQKTICYHLDRRHRRSVSRSIRARTPLG